MKEHFLLAVLCATLSLVPVAITGAQEPPSSLAVFPDFLPVRAAFLSSVITANPERALAFATTFRDHPSGRIRISVERDGDRFFVLFLRERDGAYPYGSRGNVLIEREAKTGYVTRVLWYLSDDGMSWISMTPSNERTLVDFVVAGSLVRGGYPVSRLIYYFFTNSFRYLYDATKSGLDWPLVFGEAAASPGAATLAAGYMAGNATGAAAELLRAARDFPSIGRYLAAAGAAGSAAVEETGTQYNQALSSADRRSPALGRISPWQADRGLAVEAAAGLVVSGIASDSVYIAFVEGIRDKVPARLVLVPYRDEGGSYMVLAVDADSGLPVDFAELLRGRLGARLRLYRLPAPGAAR